MENDNESIDHVAEQMRRRRQDLAISSMERLRAVARFPLVVHNIAKDMDYIIRRIDHGMEITEELEDYLQYNENQIRECYRATFGSELGQMKVQK